MRLHPLSLLLTLVLASSVGACQYFQHMFSSVILRPKISLEDLQVRSLNLNSIEFDLKFFIQNPNSFSLHFSKLNYTIAINSHRLASGAYESVIEIPKDRGTYVEFPLKLSNSEVLQLLQEMMQEKDTLFFELEGGFDFHTPLKNISLDYKIRRELFSKGRLI